MNNQEKTREFQRERRRALLHNVLEELKIMCLFVIGLPLATIFWLAWKGMYSLFVIYPMMPGISFVILIFFYACLLHNLMIPYGHRNYVEIPKVK